jgi:hypothetical protein
LVSFGTAVARLGWDRKAWNKLEAIVQLSN